VLEALTKAVGRGLGEKGGLLSKKVSELKADLRDRGLSTAGLKAALVKRLQEALDAAADADPGGSGSDDGDEESDDSGVDMDDADCDGDTDYEGYECSDSSCPCTANESTRGARHVGITLWLAADYKFLLVVLGFKGATCKHPCI